MCCLQPTVHPAHTLKDQKYIKYHKYSHLDTIEGHQTQFQFFEQNLFFLLKKFVKSQQVICAFHSTNCLRPSLSLIVTPLWAPFLCPFYDLILDLFKVIFRMILGIFWTFLVDFLANLFSDPLITSFWDCFFKGFAFGPVFRTFQLIVHLDFRSWLDLNPLELLSASTNVVST